MLKTVSEQLKILSDKLISNTVKEFNQDSIEHLSLDTYLENSRIS